MHMETRSFSVLMARVADTDGGQSARVVVEFLAQVNARMRTQGISNAELARRLGTSPAYVTRLFRGTTNLSVQTMVKLARAVGASLHLGLVGNDATTAG